MDFRIGKAVKVKEMCRAIHADILPKEGAHSRLVRDGYGWMHRENAPLRSEFFFY